MARSSIRGSANIKRILRNLPDNARGEIVDVLERAGPIVAAAMSRRLAATTKRRTGKLEAGIKWKVFPKSLRLRVGLLGTKAGRSKLFYGNILNYGRKARPMTSKSKEGRRAKLAGVAEQFSKGGAIEPTEFVTGQMPTVRQSVGSGLSGLLDRVLKQLSIGDITGK